MSYKLIPWEELIDLKRAVTVYWVRHCNGAPLWNSIGEHTPEVVTKDKIRKNFNNRMHVGSGCWVTEEMFSNPAEWWLPFEHIDDGAADVPCALCVQLCDGEICYSCRDKGAQKCEECGVWTLNPSGLCDKCIPETCSICGKEYPNNYFHNSYGDRYMLINYDDDTSICKYCNQKLKKYIYDPTLKFHGRTKTYFGIELEFELDACENDAVVVSKMDFSKNDRFIKGDGSLECGIEFVTMPCSLSYHKKNFGWDKLCAMLKKEGCNTPSNCGLHIHFSRKFNVEHEKKMYWFVYRHIKEVIKIAGRRDNNYACVRDCDPSDSGFESRSYTRYSALNFSNRNTIEFRLPAGTLSYKRIFSNLEFLDAMINYTKGKSLLNIKTLPWENFKKWLVSSKLRRERYGNLINLLNRSTIRLIHTEEDPSYDRSYI